MSDEITKVYFDMDGVLTDLDQEAHDYAVRVDEKTYSLDEMKAIPGEIRRYYLTLRKAKGSCLLFSDLSPNQLPAMRNLMLTLHESGKEVEILTSLGDLPGEMGDEAYRGKARFLRKYYGDLIRSSVLSRVNVVTNSFGKRLYAAPNALLIDDYDRNVNEWRERGGAAVLYNSSHHEETFQDVLAVAFGHPYPTPQDL